MPLIATLEAPVGRSGLTHSDVATFNTQLAKINGLGMVHYVSPIVATTEGNFLRVKDLANNNVELISTYTPAPVKDTAIAGKPTLTFGSGPTGVTGQMLAPKRYGEMDVGTGSWSMCFLMKCMGAGGTDVLVSPERAANTAVGNNSPYLRASASGDKTLGIALLDNSGVLKTVCNTHEFYNTVRLLLVCQTPGVGVKWYVDNWSTPAAQSSTDEAKEALTDGRFVLMGFGHTYSSLSFAGSLALFTAHNVDLSINNPARRDFMKAVAAYGGITSN